MSITCAVGTNFLYRVTPSNGPGNGAWSMACWMRWTANTSINQHISISENNIWDLIGGIDQQNGSTTLRFYVQKASTSQSFGVSTTLAQNTWAHVAVVWDGSNIIGYKDGVSIGSQAAAITSPPTLDYIEVGYADGQYSDAVYYAGALSADDVALLYAARNPRRRSGLFAHWPCHFASRTVDYSGQGNTATENGTLTDPAISPPASWGGPRATIILPSAASSVNLIGEGETRTAGVAAATKAASLVGAGAARSAGAATLTKAVSAVASSETVAAGVATATKVASIAAVGATRTAGLAADSVTASIAAAGATRTAGLATDAKAAELVATSLTRTAGASTVSGGSTAQLVGTGATIAAGAATLATAASMTAAGATRTTGAATLTKAVASSGSAATRTAGASTGSKASAIAPTFATRTAGTATDTKALAAIGAGTTRTAGLATFAGVAPSGGQGHDRSVDTRRMAAVSGRRRVR